MVGGREWAQEKEGEWLEGGGWVTHRGFGEIGCKVKTKRARGSFAFCEQHLPRLGRVPFTYIQAGGGEPPLLVTTSRGRLLRFRFKPDTGRVMGDKNITLSESE